MSENKNEGSTFNSYLIESAIEDAKKIQTLENELKKAYTALEKVIEQKNNLLRRWARDKNLMLQYEATVDQANKELELEISDLTKSEGN